MLRQQVKPGPPTRSPRNICYGSAKTTGQENVQTLLAADVDLVASGVGKDCTDDDLANFLKDKGIDTVAVETLTRPEVLDQVRTKTFRITVKAAQYEAALKPEVWPYRVAVRHYKQPKRQDTTWSGQSGRAGGVVQQGTRLVQQAAVQVPRQFPVGHPQQKLGNQQSMVQPLPNPVQLNNFFSLLGQLGSQEVPPH